AILKQFTAKRQLEIKEAALFKDFLKVMGISSAKRLHYTTVDLAPVLNGFQALGDDHIDTKILTAFTYALLAICKLLRRDDLACTDASKCMASRGKLVFVVVFPKEGQGGQVIIKTIVINSFLVELFSPVKTLVKYRRHTLGKARFARTTHPKSEAEGAIHTLYTIFESAQSWIKQCSDFQ
ncbi:hypothetical protein EC991_006907, partial [Linnemannia zychae]